MLVEVQDTMPGPYTSPAHDRVHTILDRGRKFTAEWQKLIRVGYGLELGWSIVADYNTEELTDDSANNKRLVKEELFAEMESSKAEEVC